MEEQVEGVQEEQGRVFLDVGRLPRFLRNLMKEAAVDLLGFYPWDQKLPDWCWRVQGETQMRIPLHTAAGYTLGCVLLGIIIGEIEEDEQVPSSGDAYYLKEEQGVYTWEACINGERISKVLALPEQVARETPARLLLSSIKILLAKQRDQKYGQESKKSFER